MMYLKVHPHKWKAFANISNLKKLTTLKDSVSEEDLLEESNKSQEKKSKKKQIIQDNKAIVEKENVKAESI